jgi:hypothetical protein
MTALSDALTAAQAKAIAALERAYLHGMIDQGELSTALAAIGARDVLEQGELFACLDVLVEYGAAAPAEQAPVTRTPVASKAQLGLIERLRRERGFEPHDFPGLTSEQASEIIDALKRGTYDPAQWEAPF